MEYYKSATKKLDRMQSKLSFLFSYEIDEIEDEFMKALTEAQVKKDYEFAKTCLNKLFQCISLQPFIPNKYYNLLLKQVLILERSGYTEEQVICLRRIFTIQDQYPMTDISPAFIKCAGKLIELIQENIEDMDTTVQKLLDIIDSYETNKFDAIRFNKTRLDALILSHKTERALVVCQQQIQLIKLAFTGEALIRQQLQDYKFLQALLKGATIDAIDQAEEFLDPREYELLEKLRVAMDHRDIEAFTDSITEYNSVNRLSSVLVSILLELKQNINNIL